MTHLRHLLMGVVLIASGCALLDDEPEIGTTRLQVMLDESARTEPLITAAENVLIRRCLQAQGLDHPFTVPDLDRPASATTGVAGAVTAAWEPERLGYRSPAVTGDPATLAYLAGLDEDEARRYERALLGSQTVTVGGDGGGTGPQTEGCQRQARIAIGGGGDVALADQYQELRIRLGTIDTEVQTLVDGDAGYREAVDTWRACLTDAGFAGLDGRPFTDPEDARDLALAVLWPEQQTAAVAPDEIRMATADRDCQDEAGLGLARYDGYLRLEGSVIDRAEVETALATWEALNEAAVDVAIDILAAEGLLSS